MSSKIGEAATGCGLADYQKEFEAHAAGCKSKTGPEHGRCLAGAFSQTYREMSARCGDHNGADCSPKGYAMSGLSNVDGGAFARSAIESKVKEALGARALAAEAGAAAGGGVGGIFAGPPGAVAGAGLGAALGSAGYQAKEFYDGAMFWKDRGVEVYDGVKAHDKLCSVAAPASTPFIPDNERVVELDDHPQPGIPIDIGEMLNSDGSSVPEPSTSGPLITPVYVGARPSISILRPKESSYLFEAARGPLSGNIGFSPVSILKGGAPSFSLSHSCGPVNVSYAGSLRNLKKGEITVRPENGIPVPGTPFTVGGEFSIKRPENLKISIGIPYIGTIASFKVKSVVKKVFKVVSRVLGRIKRFGRKKKRKSRTITYVQIGPDYSEGSRMCYKVARSSGLISQGMTLEKYQHQMAQDCERAKVSTLQQFPIRVMEVIESGDGFELSELSPLAHDKLSSEMQAYMDRLSESIAAQLAALEKSIQTRGDRISKLGEEASSYVATISSTTKSLERSASMLDSCIETVKRQAERTRAVALSLDDVIEAVRLHVERRQALLQL